MQLNYRAIICLLLNQYSLPINKIELYRYLSIFLAFIDVHKNDKHYKLLFLEFYLPFITFGNKTNESLYSPDYALFFSENKNEKKREKNHS